MGFSGQRGGPERKLIVGDGAYQALIEDVGSHRFESKVAARTLDHVGIRLVLGIAYPCLDPPKSEWHDGQRRITEAGKIY